MTTTPSGAAGSVALPEPYPFDPSCGHLSMADVSHSIREALRDASCEVVLEMRMLGHVRAIDPAHQRICLDILEALQALQTMADQLPH